MDNHSSEKYCEECGSENIEFYSDEIGRCLDCGKILQKKDPFKEDEEEKKKNQKPPPPPPPPPSPSKKQKQTSLKDTPSEGELEEELGPDEEILITLEIDDLPPSKRKIVATNERVVQSQGEKEELIDLSYEDISYVKKQEEIKTYRWLSVLGFVLVVYLMALPDLPNIISVSGIPYLLLIGLYIVGFVFFLAGLMVERSSVFLKFEVNDPTLLLKNSSRWEIELGKHVSKDKTKKLIRTIHSKVEEEQSQ